MSCNCKIIKNSKDIDEEVDRYVNNKKFTFFEKTKIIFMFLTFYFYFVTTSIFNFITKDVLEPSVPKRLLKKYNNG